VEEAVCKPWQFANAMQLAGAEYEFTNVLTDAAIAAHDRLLQLYGALLQRCFHELLMLGAESLSDIKRVITPERRERFYYGPFYFEFVWKFAGIGSPGDFGVEGNAGPSMIQVYALLGCDDD